MNGEDGGGEAGFDKSVDHDGPEVSIITILESGPSRCCGGVQDDGMV